MLLVRLLTVFRTALALALFLAIDVQCIAAVAAEPPGEPGVKISYQLPVTGPLPKTYRVTLAITAHDDSHQIVSTFVAGAVRTVTAENRGKFTETWNGLDDNFMPVPAGRYAVKGIFMPARRWKITGEYHSLVAQLTVAAGDSWFPSPSQDGRPPWTRAAGGGTMTAVAVGKNGQAVFLHNYLENFENPFLVDLTKPVGPDQILRGYPSGGTAGGEAVATDGQIIWAVSPEGRDGDMIYRADGQPFGSDNGHYRAGVYAAAGPVRSLAAWQDPRTQASYLYAAEGGAASDLLVFDGKTGTALAKQPMRGIRAVTTAGNFLFVLHRDPENHWLIERAPLQAGLPSGAWQPWLRLGNVADASDIKVDAKGRTFVSDMAGNQVYAFDQAGKLRRRFGRGSRQRPGHYDNRTFMSPGSIALWTDAKGIQKLIVVERGGAGRISEWSMEGRLLRQWFPGITTANSGYAVDQEDPNEIYMISPSGRGVIRFHVDYDKGQWRLDAVWPDIADAQGCPGGSMFPQLINAHGHKYLTFSVSRGNEDPCGDTIYRLAGDRWLPSAGIVRLPSGPDDKGPSRFAWWSGTDGYRKAISREASDRAVELPIPMSYWGGKWFDDLSLVMLADGGRYAWRIVPARFDAQGNPVFRNDDWKKILTDPFTEALAQGGSDPLRGGNELLPGPDWKDIVAMPDGGLIVAATAGPAWPEGIDSSGSSGSQVKITRYLPSDDGHFRLAWRTGRKAFGLAQPGEMYSVLRASAPINGLLAVEDGNGLVHVFTDDGLYVDTLLVDQYRRDPKKGGVYVLGGELFNGYAFLNKRNGNVYLAIGRDAGTLYRVDGWTGTGSIVSTIESLPPEVTLTAKDTAPAPSFALRVRQGGALQRVVAIAPAPGGGPAIDGSLFGWESATPISFGLDQDRAVDIRAMYDPNTLYFRVHLRLPRPIQPAAADNLDNIFADATAADTVSLYFQGDPSVSGASVDGRRGDVRFVCALVDDHGALKPVVVGMYPSWQDAASAHPVTYSSPVGQVRFAHVAPITEARLGDTVDNDGRGFTISIALPRRAIPGMPEPGSAAIQHTTIDFEATLGGKTKFWWSNIDGAASTITSDVPSEARLYPAAWGNAQFAPLGDALPLRTWSVSGPWGGPGLAKIVPPGPGADSNRWKAEILALYRSAHYPPDAPGAPVGTAYQGPLSMDASGAAHALAWRDVQTNEGDDELHLSDPGALYYAAAWIWSPDARQVKAEFLHPPQNEIDAWLNGVALPNQRDSPPPIDVASPAAQTLDLHPGWNALRLRGFAVGYQLGLGVRLRDSSDRLWQLKTSAAPPPS